MQSNLVIEAGAEISSFLPKTSSLNEKLSTKTDQVESKLNRALSSSKSEKITIEATNSATDLIPSRSHPNRDSNQTCNKKNSGGTAVYVSPVTRLTTSSPIIGHSHHENRTRVNDQYVEHDELHETSASAIESPLKELSPSKNDLHSDRADSGNKDLVENGGRFLIPPPKYSNLCSFSLDHEGVPLSAGVFYTEQKHVNSPLGPSLTPQISEREEVVNPSIIQQKGQDASNKNSNVIGTIIRDDEYSDIIVHDLGTKDGDNISNFPESEKFTGEIEQDQREQYEYEENTSEKDFKNRRRFRQRRKQRILSESVLTDDEMSVENYGAITSSHLNALQERTHQAWKSRQRKNATMRLKNDSESQKGSNVSFGASDTIYHFDPDISKRKKCINEEQEDNISLDRSLNSEYTKTLESEVEDMIKDILLIGSPNKNKPGRRKYRYKPDIEKKSLNDRKLKGKKENCAQVVESSRLGVRHGIDRGKIEDDPSQISAFNLEKVDDKSKSTNDSGFSLAERKKVSGSKFQSHTYGDDMRSLGSTISRESSVDSNTVETFQSEKDIIDDPLNAMIGLFEGGISVMTSAIGYALGDETATQTEIDTNDCQKVINDFDIFESCGIHIRDEKAETACSSQILSRTTNALSRNALIDSNTNNTVLIDSKHSSLYSKKAGKKIEVHKEQDGAKVVVVENKNKSDCQTMNFGRGHEFTQLAIHAARSVHKLKGFKYDESVVINMYKEVKTIHVTLELPLGSKFLDGRHLPTFMILQIICSS